MKTLALNPWKLLVTAGLVAALVVVLLLESAESQDPAIAVLTDQFDGLASSSTVDRSTAGTIIRNADLKAIASVDVDGLPGSHTVSIVRPSSGESVDGQDSLCISGRLDGSFGSDSEYTACQYWQYAKEHGLFAAASTTEGFQVVVFVPGTEAYTVTFDAVMQGYSGVEIADENGLIVAQGPAGDATSKVLGRIVVDRANASPIVIDVENPSPLSSGLDR